ncbi:Histidine kinase-like ATPase domain-containing protein [Klenkia marina]|uniref:Histidine kinase-like ATPase domain-containing protein n=1 Tax=Klenkia marina TaxID=1960309 RepID=A0A1G4XHG7_9ACTN|nr:ATP-binding protein [Klenkia marina]SCX40673.1 Histidine kinase-like ATPase domain-containing protein [Klenkia marina]
MAEHTTAWQQHHPPEARPLWHWAPTGLADLPRIRRDLRDRISEHRTDGRPAVADPDMFVLAVDELMSNALRHGRTPVEVDIGRTDDAWLLTVCDRAVEDPPRPALDRDPAEGGMGLGLVAHAALGEGWYASDAGKHVWVLLP